MPLKNLKYFSCLMFLLVFYSICYAQQQFGSEVRKLDNFEDKKMDEYIHKILLQMDVFRSDSSIIFIDQALNYIEPTEQIEEYYYLLSYRAEVLYYDGLFNEAMQDLDKCSQLASQLEDSLLMANIFNLRGLLNETIQNNKEALVELGNALKYFPRHPSARYPVTELYHVYGNIGVNLLEIDLIDSAKICLEKSLELAKEANAERAIAVAYWSLGELELKKKNSENALVYFVLAEGVATEAKDKDIELDALSGQCMAMSGIKSKKEIMEAMSKADIHLENYSVDIGLITQRNFAKQSALVWELIEEPEMAIKKLNKWYTLDSLIQKKNTQSALATQAALLRSDIALDLEQIKYAQAASDLEQARIKQILLLTSGLFAILFLSTLLITFRKRQKQKLLLSKLEMERLTQEKTIAEFKIREQLAMDMHDDLGAGLSALKLQSEMVLRREKHALQKEQIGQIAKNAGELMESMRQIIWSLDAEQGSVEELIDYISNYARIYLSENDLGFHLQKDDQWPSCFLNSEQRRNIFLVIKEVLHNSVKHANSSQIEMTLHWNNGIEITIQDNGIGMKVEISTYSGNGHKNISKRILKLGGSVKWVNINGTLVIINIPLSPN